MKTRFLSVLALVLILPFACGETYPRLDVRAGAPIAAVRGQLTVVALGDSGTGGAEQQRVATAMGNQCRALGACDLALLLGDNFYPAGVRSVSDPQWQTAFEIPYGPLRFPFYVSLGNHDYDGNMQAQIEYATTHPQWRLPARYYSFSAEDVDFFAIDTVRFDANQLAWLTDGLRASTSRWRVVFGHYPVVNAGAHGDSEDLKRRLWPLLQANADFYLSGHDHNMQVFAPVGRVRQVIVGSGGKELYRVTPGYPGLEFGRSTHGFATLEFGAAAATVTFRNAQNVRLHRVVVPR